MYFRISFSTDCLLRKITYCRASLTFSCDVCCELSIECLLSHSPSAFETVGHIAHLNLRAEQLPYKTLIGSVLLDKLSPRVRTVVNKTESTGGPYRIFEMETIAGESDFVAEVKENGCRFQMDFSKVYWNSRLETEHRRIIDSVAPSDVLADAFCGIGPFAVPAAKQKKCAVYANDLNPASVDYLRKNAMKNGIRLAPDGKFDARCGCARDFLKTLIRQEKVPITKVVMNFPSGAPEFLDAFIGMYTGLEDLKLPMPVIHCYCFVRGDNWAEDARDRILTALQLEKSDEFTMDIREVRDVAPRKRYVCVTFSLPSKIAYHSRVAAADLNSDSQSALSVKRQRMS